MKTVFRDKYLIVVHKPSGMTVYGDTSPGEKSAYDILKSSLRLDHLYPVHRLDKGTCGLVMFAFDPKVAALLERDFREGKIKKNYNFFASSQKTSISDKLISDNDLPNSPALLSKY